MSLSCVRSSLSQTVRSCVSPRRFVRVSLVCPFVSLPEGSFMSFSCVRLSLSRTVRSCLSRVFVRSLPDGCMFFHSCGNLVCANCLSSVCCDKTTWKQNFQLTKGRKRRYPMITVKTANGSRSVGYPKWSFRVSSHYIVPIDAQSQTRYTNVTSSDQK